MYNLGDDHELDQMSREAAGGYDSPGKANWQALSNELDKVMPVEKKKRRFLFWWLLPVLLAGTGIIYTLYQQNKKTDNLQTTALPSSKTSEVRSSAPATTLIETENTTKSIQVEKDVIAIDNPLKTSVNPGNTQTFSNQKAPETKIKASTQNDDASLAQKANTKQIQTNTESKLVNEKVEEPAKSIETKSSSITPPVEKPLAKQQEVDKQVSAEKTSANTEAIEKTPESSTETIASKEVQTSLPKRGKGFSFSLLTGVDKSTVKFTYGEKPGFNIGVLAGYHFNDKWAIKTGAIYTQKNYKLAGEDFTAPKGTPISYYNLDMVEGYCKMWEIPFLVSHTLINNGKKSVSLNTGLSSYFMTSEKYNYYYYYNGVPQEKEAEYNSTDTHILSILHLSAGFENRLSKNTSLIIEPYAKFPLGGVGFGSIRLSSFGLNFSVQYRQPGKK